MSFFFKFDFMTNFGKWVHAISTDLMLNGNLKLKMLALMNHLFKCFNFSKKFFFNFMLKVKKYIKLIQLLM